MPATKASIIAATILAATRLTLLGEPLAESGASSYTPPAVVATVRHEEGPGLLPTDRVYITAGTNKFSFLVPPGYKMEPWADGRVALVNQDYSCQITFRLAGPLPPDGGELNPDVYSERVLAEHPGAKILKAFSGIADSRRGPVFEVECSGPASSLRRGQIAFIPSWSAVVEFNLVCSPEKFAAARQQLNTVMLTFRASDPKGELHISPLSDKI